MWKELIKNEVWLCEDFLPDVIEKELLAECKSSSTFSMAPGESIRDVFDGINVNPTLYDYDVRYVGIRENRTVTSLYFKRLNELFGLLDGDKPLCKLNKKLSLQLFAKSFSQTSFYEIHAEPVNRYGDFAFVHFLEDCDGGELVFPSPLELGELIRNDDRHKKAYEGTLKLFNRLGEDLRLIGPLVISPIAGHCVVFKVGSLHFVNAMNLSTNSKRISVTGWPFVTENLIKDLNKKCNLQYHFDDKDLKKD